MALSAPTLSNFNIVDDNNFSITLSHSNGDSSGFWEYSYEYSLDNGTTWIDTSRYRTLQDNGPRTDTVNSGVSGLESAERIGVRTRLTDISSGIGGEDTPYGYVWYVAPAKVKHTLTIYYQYADGTEAAPTITVELEEGESYSYSSPSIDKYEPDTATITGTMGTTDKEEYVIYTRIPSKYPILYAPVNGKLRKVVKLYGPHYDTLDIDQSKWGYKLRKITKMYGCINGETTLIYGTEDSSMGDAFTFQSGDSGSITFFNKWTTPIIVRNMATKNQIIIQPMKEGTIPTSKTDFVKIYASSINRTFRNWAPSDKPLVSGRWINEEQGTVNRENLVTLIGMPAMKAFTTDSKGTIAGDNFFRGFNNAGMISNLLSDTFDTSNIQVMGDYAFEKFTRRSVLVQLPEGSFNFSSLRSVGVNFLNNFNQEGHLTSLPKNSFNTENIETAGVGFCGGFNRSGDLIVLPELAFSLAGLTRLPDYSFSYFNEKGDLTCVPASSFGTRHITSMGSECFAHFNDEGQIPEAGDLDSRPYIHNGTNASVMASYANGVGELQTHITKEIKPGEEFMFSGVPGTSGKPIIDELTEMLKDGTAATKLQVGQEISILDKSGKAIKRRILGVSERTVLKDGVEVVVPAIQMENVELTATKTVWTSGGPNVPYSASTIRQLAKDQEKSETEEFLSCLGETKVQSLTRDGTIDVVYDKMYVASLTEMGVTFSDLHNSPEQRAVEGTPFTYYAGITEEPCPLWYKYNLSVGNHSQSYWLRSYDPIFPTQGYYAGISLVASTNAVPATEADAICPTYNFIGKP